MSAKGPALSRLLGYCRSHRRRIVSASIFSVLNKLLDLAPPVLIGLAVDAVVQGEGSFLGRLGVTETMSQIWGITISTVVIFGLESLTQFVAMVQWRNLAQTVQHELRIDAYAHMQGLETAFFEERGTGQLMSVLNDDVNQLERFLDIGAHELLQVAATVAGVGIWFCCVSPSLAVMAMLPMPLIVLGSVRFQKAIAPRYADVREKVGAINARLANNLGGIATIKSFTAEGHEVARLRDESDAYRRSNRRAIRLSSAFTPLIRMIIVWGLVASLAYGGYLASTGGITTGEYATVLFLTQRMLWPLTRLGQTFDLYQRAMASTDRALDLLAAEAEIRSGSRRIAASEVRGEVELQDVGFAYRTGRPLMDGLTLRIPAGETTAIVGPTGSGKTTLVKLLLRFYDVTAGCIRIDGHDLRDLDLRDLRNAIGVVSQDVFLFHGSVVENIAYGKRDATLEEVAAAAELAEAHEFIAALPHCYDTIVGERGQKLSGGQRQRISIARAILKDPPILILDEATSSVDNETEAAIQRSLARLAVGRTTIVIAHRLSTIRHADRIYVLEQGRIAEHGHHDELVEHEGTYANLWRVQTGLALKG